MTIKVLVSGYTGRMGTETVKAIENDSALTLAGTTHLGDNLQEAIKKSQANVVVDFTTALTVFEHTNTIIESGAHPVIGTSGLLPEQVNHLQKLCSSKKLGCIVAPNFSIGAVLMMKYAQDAAHYLPHVEVIEMHHDEKADSPSGTAMKTCEMIASQRETTPEIKLSKETIPGARGANYHDIAIHAVRLPGLVAHQQVIFGGTGETLTLRHDSINRECFMPGVVLACKKVVELNELVYGLEHLL